MTLSWRRIGQTFATGSHRRLMPDREQLITGGKITPGRLLPTCLAMIDNSIAFLDSGIGGLPYLDWIRSRRPDLAVSYLADTAHFPYGDMSSEAVRDAVVGAVRRLLKVGTPRLLTVACNTASVTALEDIRAIAPCPVVGTVPAVKPAAGLALGGPIGVLATSGTVDSPYLDRLVSAFAGGREVVRVAAGDIVRFVEERWLEEGNDGALQVLEPALDKLKESGAASVVLGCTHFLHVLEPIERIMGPEIPIIDSRDGVGRRILSLLDEEISSPESDPENADGHFLVTGGGISDERYRQFAAVHQLSWSGELD